MLHLTRPGRRSLAGLAAAAVGVAGLGVAGVAPAARADASPATLTWGFSGYLESGGQLPPTNPTGGAAIDAADTTIVFSGGTSADLTGTTAEDLTYTGSIEFASPYLSDGVPAYEVTFANPEVVVDTSGAGQIRADVSWDVPASSRAPEQVGSVDNVLLTTFTATPDDWTAGGLSATPDWTGVAAADAYGTGKPVGGASWNPAFVSTIPSSINPFFYASGSSSDATKAPSAFTVQTTAPQISDTVASASYADGLTLNVDGTGFRGVTVADDDGVYVGLAPSGGLPDVSSPAGMAAFAGAQWVSADQIADGAFATTLNAPTSALDPSTSYSLYAWQAHSHSTTSQDTETSVTIDWSTLRAPAPVQTAVSLGLSGATTKKYGTAASLKLTATGLTTGSVKVTGLGVATTVVLKNGSATIAIPRTLAVGKHTVTVSYAGDDTHKTATSTRTVAITKATAKIKATWTTKPTHKKAGKLAVKVAGFAGATLPGGKVKVTLVHGKKKVKVAAQALAKGAVKLKVRKLAKGSWKVTVTYVGNSSYSAASKKTTLRVVR